MGVRFPPGALSEQSERNANERRLKINFMNMTSEQKTSSPREVFLHLLAMVTLYMSAFSFGKLIFDYVGRVFPDPLEMRGYGAIASSASSDSMRWSIAMLVIVFPVYFFTTRFLQRLYVRDPFQQTRRIRKWLVYLTLFLSAVAIIIDLVTVLYKFLGGELSVRFVLEVLTVLFIAAAIFGYYFWELRHFREAGSDTTPALSRMRYFVAVIVVAVIANAVTGFFMVGSPQKERMARFDSQRINDLQIVQNEVLNFWQQKARLPATLDELKNDITGFVAPNDPATGLVYEYREVAPLKFELCAVFATSSSDNGKGMLTPAVPYPVSMYDGFGNWDHAIGRVCFTRTIDPERFRPVAPVKG